MQAGFDPSRLWMMRHPAGLCPPRGTSGDYSITGFALSQYAGSVKKIFAIRALSPSCSDLESSCKNCKFLQGRLCLFRNIQGSPFCHISPDCPPAEVSERGIPAAPPDRRRQWPPPRVSVRAASDGAAPDVPPRTGRRRGRQPPWGWASRANRSGIQLACRMFRQTLPGDRQKMSKRP